MEIKTSYTVSVEQDGDDFVLPFPDELLESVGWEIGDTIGWEQNEDGSWTLSKVSKDENDI